MDYIHFRNIGPHDSGEVLAARLVKVAKENPNVPVHLSPKHENTMLHHMDHYCGYLEGVFTYYSMGEICYFNEEEAVENLAHFVQRWARDWR